MLPVKNKFNLVNIQFYSMETYQEQLREVISHFNNGNENLGFRMLVDIILDTEKLANYNKCIELVAWQELNPLEGEQYKSKVIALAESMLTDTFHETVENKILIRATGVEKKYGKKTFSLGPISFEIRSGQLFGLVGENGNGKTTLLRILASDLHASSGVIEYPSLNKSEDLYAQRTKLTYIPQRTPKWYGNVKDNLKFTATHYGIEPSMNESLVLIWMIRFGLWKFRNHHWDELSSGYKMRFELARTFLRRPQLLLLDEPLANLDILSQQLILEDLKMLGKSLTHPLAIMLSSQQLYEVEKVSDEVVFLKNGKASSFNQLKNKQDESSLLVVEIEILNTKEALIQAIGENHISEIKLLGSNYYVEITNMGNIELLKKIAEAQIEVKYFRNISESTRRFFNT